MAGGLASISSGREYKLLRGGKMDGSQKFLIPREGLMVRDPVSKTPLAAAGEWKTIIGPAGRYWRRRIDCGDVKISEPQVQSSLFESKTRK